MAAASTNRAGDVVLHVLVVLALLGATAVAAQRPAGATSPPAGAAVVLADGDVLLSSRAPEGVVGSVEHADEDVVRYDAASRTFELVLDGSDVGLTRNLDAVVALADGSLLLSHDRRYSHADVGLVMPQDVVRFVPVAYGADTRGTLELFLDGSDVGLSAWSEDVDAITVTADGSLAVSTRGWMSVDGFGAGAKDLVVLDDAVFGAATEGRWRRMFAGADTGLRAASERIDGASVDGATGAIHLTTIGAAAVRGLAATGDDVVTCVPDGLPPGPTSCAFALQQSFAGVDVDALHVGPSARLAPDCDEPQQELEITSHAAGEVVDTGEDGTGTGSFVLAGLAPAGATVTVSVAGETEPAEVVEDDCGVAWSIEVTPLAGGSTPFAVSATGPGGDDSAEIALDLVPPGPDELLVQPTFASTPQLHDRLVAYDDATGMLLFDGDVTDELAPGDGLGGGSTPMAPDGYLRIVEGAAFDGARTTVATRQAGLTEFVRQVEVDHTIAQGDVRPIVISTEDDPPSGPSTSRAPDAAGADEVTPEQVPIDDDTSLKVEFNVNPGVEFELDIDWERPCWICPPIQPSLERLWFEGSLELTAQVEITHSATGVTTGEQPFGPRFDDYRLGGLSIPTPIGVPIVLTFEAESQAFYEIAVTAGFKIEYGLTFQIEAGFEYDSDGSGRGTYRGADVEGGAPSLDDVDVGIIAQAAAGLEIDFEVLLYGQGGIEIEARPQIEFEAVGDVIDREISWELKLIVPFAGGLEIEIRIGPIGWEREFGNLEFVELSLTLFEGVIGGDGGGDDPLVLQYDGPPGVFPGQTFSYRVRIENTGDATAEDVRVRIVLPSVGGFVSSSPPGTPDDPSPGSTYVIRLPDIPAGAVETAVLRWRAPTPGGVDAVSRATVLSADGQDVGPVTATVPVGLEGNCNPCGATAAGTGLRNRARGAISITDVPPGATVTRAVLVWGILYDGPVPRNTITFDGSSVAADLTSTVSGTLCWGDTATVGYAADVTDLVDGNGTYVVSDPPRGTTRVDDDPLGVLPYTDGASLVVFYVGGGSSDQVLSDFTYNTNTERTIVRTLTDVNSVGGPASLTLAGPDGQGNGGEVLTVTGSGSIDFVDTWNGSDPQQGPSFPIGNLWDTDTYDVSSVLPAGQGSLTLDNELTDDCIGVGATVLSVAQRAP